MKEFVHGLSSGFLIAAPFSLIVAPPETASAMALIAIGGFAALATSRLT